MTIADNAQKTPFTQSQNRFAEQKIADAMQQLGRALPCKVVSIQGQIVTVSFEITDPVFTLPQVTIPIATSKYDWIPIQAGDLGVTVPADVYLGGVSGLGSGTADLSQRANLTALQFVPCANKAWTVQDPNKRLIQGPSGVVLQDTGGSCVFTLTPTGITITVGGKTWTWNANGLTVEGFIYSTNDMWDNTGTNPNTVRAMRQIYDSHTHTQPPDTHGDGEQPTNIPTQQM